MTSIPCGPPNPRNAVWDVLWVRAIRPWTRTWGIQYALSTWHSARASTGSDRSRLHPPSDVRVASRARSRPSSSKATRHWAWNPCRLPVIVMSWVRVSRSRTGRPVSRAPRAAIAANPWGCISLPPKPPPMRRHCTVTAWLGHAEDVGDDVLGLGGVLGAALDEDLPGLVDLRERRSASRGRSAPARRARARR